VIRNFSLSLCWLSLFTFLLIAMQAFLPYTIPLDMATQADIVFTVLPKIFVLGFIPAIIAELVQGD
jgi:hypothetical protein